MAVALGTLVLAGTVAPPAPDVTTTGAAAPERNRRYEATAASALDRVRWRRDTRDRASAPVATPVLTGETLVVTAGGAVEALDGRDGTRRWRVELGDGPATSARARTRPGEGDAPEGVVTADGTRVYVLGAGVLHALDRSDGAVVWSVPVPGSGRDTDGPGRPLAAHDGVVDTIAADGRLVRFASDGSVVWELRGRDLVALEGRGRHGFVAGPVRVAGSVVAVASIGGRDAVLYAVGPDGAVAWRLPLGAVTATSPVVVGDTVVAASGRGLVAVDGRTGAVRWGDEGAPATAGVPAGIVRWRERTARSRPVGALAAVGDRVLAVSGDRVEVRSGRTGRPIGRHRWREDVRAVGTAAVTHHPRAASWSLPVHTADGAVIGLDPAFGSPRWRRTDLAVGAARTVGGPGVLYAPTADGSIVALDARDGRERWRSPILATTTCEVAGGGDLTYVVTEGRLHAFEPDTGLARWTHDPPAPLIGGIVADADRVVGVDDDGLVTILDPSDGAVVRRAVAGSGAFGSPVVVDDSAYVSGGDRTGLGGQARSGWVRAVDLRDAGSSWLRYVSGPLAGPVTVSGRTVVAVGRDGVVDALERSDGSPRWRAETGRPADGPAVVGGGVVVVTDRDGGVTGLDLATGARRWHAGFGVPLRREPVVAVGLVVTRASGGALVAIDATSGAPRWRAEVDAELTSPPAVAGDAVYVGTAHGIVVLGVTDGRIRDRIARRSPVVVAPLVGPEGLTVCQADGSVVALGRPSP